MASIVDQLSRGVNNLVHEGEAALGQVSKEAQSAAASIGSIVNGKVSGPAADKFGSDPVQFTLNVCKSFNSQIRRACNNLTAVKGKTTFNVGGKTVPAKLDPGAPTARVALVLALHAKEDPRGIVDQAGRVGLGLDAGRGLSDHVWPLDAHSHDGGRGLFGIDDAILIGGLVTLIVGLAPLIISSLVAVVGSIGGAIAPKDPKKDAPAKDPNAATFGIDPVFLLVGAAAIVAAFLVMRHLKAKGGAPA